MFISSSFLMYCLSSWDPCMFPSWDKSPVINANFGLISNWDIVLNVSRSLRYGCIPFTVSSGVVGIWVSDKWMKLKKIFVET